MVGELKRQVEYFRRNKVAGLLPLGSTGEFVHLELNERKQFLKTVADLAQDLPLIVNISDVKPKAVFEMAGLAREVGAAAVSVLPPYFFSVAQADLVEFFVRAGEAAKIPLFLYNFPERTGTRIDLETVQAVAGRIELAGVKQSGAEFSYHRELAELGKRMGFDVLTGSDTRLPEAMGMGVSGCVSGLSNALAEVLVPLFEAVRSANTAEVDRLQGKMAQVAGVIDRLEFPRNVAAVMEARGFCPGAAKAVTSPRTDQTYRELVKELREIIGAWNLGPVG